MKIDDEARTFFGSYDTLERLDSLQTAFHAYLRDLADHLFDQIDNDLNTLSQKNSGWLAKRNKTSKERGASMRNEKIKGFPPIEIGFWCTENEEWSCFNSAWLGVRSPSKHRRKEIQRLLSSLFPSQREEPDYPIFEYLKAWPDLDNEPYVSLHRVTSDGGRQIIEDIVDRVGEIVTAITAIE
jgi:hypothetical protein